MILIKIFFFIACYCMFFDFSETISVECKNGYEKYPVIVRVYECNVQNNLSITSKDSAVIDSVIDAHKNETNMMDVNAFYAYEKNIKFIPRGLEKVFVNLKAIWINLGQIREIHQDDFKDYVRLEYLNLEFNKIEILEEGLFDYNPELKFIRLFYNKILHIVENVFDNLNKLEWLHLEYNKCISKNVETNAEVKELINDIKVMCQSNEYMSINEELKQLEEATTSESIKTCQEFVPELQKIENKFQQSDISSSIIMKEKIQKVSNEGVYGQFCIINGSLVGLDRALANFKNETKNMIDQSAASINEETKKILDQIDNMQKANNEKFAALDACMKAILNKLSKTQEP